MADSSNPRAGSPLPAAHADWPKGGPGPLRGITVIAALAAALWALGGGTETGEDAEVTSLGKIEVLARFIDDPSRFPVRGAYKFTFVVKYEVVEVLRPDPDGNYDLKPGDLIYVGQYMPHVPRSQAHTLTTEFGPTELGGKLNRFVTGDVHRMALMYPYMDWKPRGSLDFVYPLHVNRFFAMWTNPTSY